VAAHLFAIADFIVYFGRGIGSDRSVLGGKADHGLSRDVGIGSREDTLLPRWKAGCASES
jgi:hypothetical protein